MQAILRLIIPFTTMWLLTFFIIFECILNAAAEMTRFGDRQFYSDWWNSTTFDEFSRKVCSKRPAASFAEYSV